MAYSADLRNKALNYYEPCKNISQTAATFNLSRNTLYLWMRLEAKAAAAALVLGAGVFLYVGGTEVDFFGLQRQIAPGKELGGLGVDAFAGGNHGVAVQTADPAGDGGGEVVVLGGAVAGLAVADIGYAVAHAEGKAGTAGAVGVFVAVVVLGSIELDFTAGG